VSFFISCYCSSEGFSVSFSFSSFSCHRLPFHGHGKVSFRHGTK
jgi:hypothetical protein